MSQLSSIAIAASDAGVPDVVDAELVDEAARQLARAIGRGDEAAFRRFHDAYRGRLFAFALCLGGGDTELAQDIVQAAMLTAATKLREIDGETHLWNWLARVARQHLMAALKRRRRQPDLVPLDSIPEIPCPEPDRRDIEHRLQSALATLDPADRELVEQFYHDSRSREEIAAPLGITVKTVSNRLDLIRRKLRSLVFQPSNHHETTTP